MSVPLALFFGVMMFVLDTGFRALSDRSLNELLDSQMVALVAAAEPQPGGGYAPPNQDMDPRLTRPRSIPLVVGRPTRRAASAHRPPSLT